MNMKKSAIAVTMALGTGVLLPQTSIADTIDLSFNGFFRMIDPTGAALANTSVVPTTKGQIVNQYETAISGTMHFDLATGAGTGNMNSFLFFGNPIPAVATGISMQAIGNGLLDSNFQPLSGFDPNGSLVLVNMLFNWGGNNGIPTSLVLDAAGFFGSMPTVYGNGYGANGTVINGSAPGSVRGAVDGTYVSTLVGNEAHQTSKYLNLGVVPIATTKWNTTATCTPGGGNAGACMNVAVSGITPLVTDTFASNKDFNALFMGGNGSYSDGVGGSPMLAGPFEGYSANFDVTTLTVTQLTQVAQVPVPAAVWLLGSGLLGLVGVARRRKTA